MAGSSGLRRFAVAIPAAVVSDTPHLREKTAKLGTIARACSVFGVNEIAVYTDTGKESAEEDSQFVVGLLRYLDTPQYLRKKLFKLKPEFKFAGILPPLQTPPHEVPRERSALRVGDIREGVVVAKRGGIVEVDAGLNAPLEALGDQRPGERVTLRLSKPTGSLQWEILDSSITDGQTGTRPTYWGYHVKKVKTLGAVLSDGPWGLRVGTSRYGTPVQEVLPSLSEDLKAAQSVVVAFGAPKIGLREILAAENIEQEHIFNYFLNTAPDQRTVTVRTEEALVISLSLLNLASKLVK